MTLVFNIDILLLSILIICNLTSSTYISPSDNIPHQVRESHRFNNSQELLESNGMISKFSIQNLMDSTQPTVQGFRDFYTYQDLIEDEDLMDNQAGSSFSSRATSLGIIGYSSANAPASIGLIIDNCRGKDGKTGKCVQGALEVVGESVALSVAGAKLLARDVGFLTGAAQVFNSYSQAVKKRDIASQPCPNNNEHDTFGGKYSFIGTRGVKIQCKNACGNFASSGQDVSTLMKTVSNVMVKDKWLNTQFTLYRLDSKNAVLRCKATLETTSANTCAEHITGVACHCSAC